MVKKAPDYKSSSLQKFLPNEFNIYSSIFPKISQEEYYNVHMRNIAETEILE